MSDSHILQNIEEQITQNGRSDLPPVEDWNPPLSGRMDLVIDEQGRWRHEGSLIQRESLVRLFSSILKREQDGQYYLVTPVEKFAIEVMDAPFLATQMTVTEQHGRQYLEFETSVGDRVPANRDHPIWVIEKENQPRPYVRVRANLDALISRNLFYELVELAKEQVDAESGCAQLVVESAGESFVLGKY